MRTPILQDKHYLTYLITKHIFMKTVIVIAHFARLHAFKTNCIFIKRSMWKHARDPQSKWDKFPSFIRQLNELIKVYVLNLMTLKYLLTYFPSSSSSFPSTLDVDPRLSSTLLSRELLTRKLVDPETLAIPRKLENTLFLWPPGGLFIVPTLVLFLLMAYKKVNQSLMY